MHLEIQLCWVWLLTEVKGVPPTCLYLCSPALLKGELQQRDVGDLLGSAATHTGAPVPLGVGRVLLKNYP